MPEDDFRERLRRVWTDPLALGPGPGRGPWRKRLAQLLDTLTALGRVQALEDGRYRSAE